MCRLPFGELFSEVENGAPVFGRLDCGIGFEEFRRAWLVQSGDMSRKYSRCLRRNQVADHIYHAALERLRNSYQPREAHPVRAMLVFLDLLKRDADLACKLILAKSEFTPPQADAAAQGHVKWVWPVICRVFAHVLSLSRESEHPSAIRSIGDFLAAPN